jgi:glycosyltransferase involved in cell wall biosynthesis
MKGPLKVAMEARLAEGQAGGILQIVVGMAQGLAQLQDGDEEYHFHVYPEACAWLEPYLKGPCRRLDGSPLGRPVQATGLRALLKPLARLPAVDYARALLAPPLPASDGAVEAAGCEVVHFMYPVGFKTALPNLFQPHDLQHLHFPEFFSRGDRLRRARSYPAYFAQASEVVLMTDWGRRDLLQHFPMPADKVPVIPGGAVTAGYPLQSEAQRQALRQRLGLQEAFFLYPAKAYPHKNHLALAQALAWLRDEKGLRPQMVCTGAGHRHHEAVLARVKSLGLQEQWVDAGYLSPGELGSLYAMARAMVFPSKFEGWGLPVTEAFEQGLPVACARATALPDHAGDAALYFEPDDVVGMAMAMERLWTDAALRQDLILKGRLKAGSFSWEKSARIFRAWYRRLASRPLSEEDRHLIAGSLAGPVPLSAEWSEHA